MDQRKLELYKRGMASRLYGSGTAGDYLFPIYFTLILPKGGLSGFSPANALVFA